MLTDVILSFDYELFFGPRSGTVENCLLSPTRALAEVLGRHGVPATFFVDAGFLVALDRDAPRDPEVARQRAAVREQLRVLAAEGHDLQLHIHPHWEDSRWDGARWVMDTRRFRLPDFGATEIDRIVGAYADAIASVASRKPRAYRAGGFCAQPFGKLAPALARQGIRIDSSVYPGGRSISATHAYDYRSAPRSGLWRFSDDPARPDPAGAFVEVPIASRTLGPLFNWKLAVKRLGGSPDHKAFGDGQSVPLGRMTLGARLLYGSVQPVSCDGYKAAELARGFAAFRTSRAPGYFVTLGHPKAQSLYSLHSLAAFIADASGSARFATFADVPA